MANGRIRSEKSPEIASTWLKLMHENGARAFSHSLDPEPTNRLLRSRRSEPPEQTLHRAFHRNYRESFAPNHSGNGVASRPFMWLRARRILGSAPPTSTFASSDRSTAVVSVA